MAGANDRPVPISPSTSGLQLLLEDITVGSLPPGYIEGAQKNYSVFANTGGATFFLRLIKALPATHRIGIYDAWNPANQAEIFGGGEQVGDAAVIRFLFTGEVEKSGQVIAIFSVPLKVGFYVEAPGGTVHSQDILNLPDENPRALVFQGEDPLYNGSIRIGGISGFWTDSELIFAFEDGADDTFDDVVFIVQSILPCTGVIGDLIWQDANEDGLQGNPADEPGIGGVEVTLKSGLINSGTVLATTSTGDDGSYFFDGLCPWLYTVEYELPAGYSPTLEEQGPDREVDSNPNPQTGIFIPLSKNYDLTIDFGLILDQVCELTLEASCLVVPPPPCVSGSDCKGKVTRLKVEYTGLDCSASSHTQKPGKVSCEDLGALTDSVFIRATDGESSHCKKGKIWFEGTVLRESDFEIEASKGGEDSLGANTWVLIYDREGGTLLQKVLFHTSCSQPLKLFDQFGSLKILEISSRDGGTVTPDNPYPPDCGGICGDRHGKHGKHGKVRAIEMAYTGEDCGATSHGQKPGKVSCQDLGVLTDSVFIRASDRENSGDHRARIWFEGTVLRDSTFHIDALNAGKDRLEANTWVLIYDREGGALLQKVQFHTSCSQPLNLFDQFGSLRVLGLTGQDGTTVTPPDLEPPTPQPGCTIVKGSGGDACDSKVRVLQMAYTAEDCSSTSHGQKPGKASCLDLGALPDTVFIRASDRENPADGKARVWFQDVVSLGEIIDIDANVGGEDQLKANTWIHIFDAPGGNLLQKVQYHTSCSQPIVPGDQVGSMEVVGLIGTDGSNSSLGSEVIFTYRVTNTGSIPALNIIVEDIYGVVQGSPIAALAPGDSVELEVAALISETTVNEVVALGDPGCEARDTVEIIVEKPPPPPPPPPAESCDDGKPMVLTMEYTGDDCGASHNDQKSQNCQDDPCAGVHNHHSHPGGKCGGGGGKAHSGKDCKKSHCGKSAHSSGKHGKASCVDPGALPGTVYILASDRENPLEKKARVWFEGTVLLNSSFDIDARNAGEGKLKANTWVLIYDRKGGTLLQKVQIHTSCSQPLNVGDQFASLLLVGFIPEQ